MIKFITISILFIVVECVVADKFEAFLNEKSNKKGQESEYEADMETLRILSNYGLINSESYKCKSSTLDKV